MFSLNDLAEINYFLCVEATETSFGKIQLTQTKYIWHLLTKARISDAKPMPIPMISSLKLSAHGDI